MLFLLHDHVLTTVTMNTLETMHPQSQGSKKKKKVLVPPLKKKFALDQN